MSDSRVQGLFKPKRRFGNKLPGIYLDSVNGSKDPHHIEIFLVNAFDETLEFVASPQPLLFIASLAHANIQDDILVYENVAPGEAVKIAEFDEVHDNGLLHRLTVLWQCPHGEAQHATITAKCTSKFTYRVLRWREE